MILEPCNEIEGASKPQTLNREEYILDSNLSNRAAFNRFDYAADSSQFRISLESEAEVWLWRKFLHWLRGSYRTFYVPTFQDDLPGVTTADSNVFTAPDTDLTLLFGDPPDPRRNALRFEYDDGTILYRRITDIVDNVDTEQITVNLAVIAGTPKISFLQECRILGDTATFVHNRNDDVILTFRFRTILR